MMKVIASVLPRDDGSEMNVTQARLWFEKMLLNEVRNLLSLLVIIKEVKVATSLQFFSIVRSSTSPVVIMAVE
jgi:hypothetical protein